MSKITLSEPNGPYRVDIDTEVMQVELRDVFLGVRFVTESGEELSVCMRDGGFEVRHFGYGFDTGWIEFKNGTDPVLDASHRPERGGSAD